MILYDADGTTLYENNGRICLHSLVFGMRANELAFWHLSHRLDLYFMRVQFLSFPFLVT